MAIQRRFLKGARSVYCIDHNSSPLQRLEATGLQPSRTATTVRNQNGQRKVQDGPFADTKEQLGGVYIIDVPDLDTALEWAARNPAASLAGVEVRPIIGVEVRPTANQT